MAWHSLWGDALHTEGLERGGHSVNAVYTAHEELANKASLAVSIYRSRP